MRIVDSSGRQNNRPNLHDILIRHAERKVLFT